MSIACPIELPAEPTLTTSKGLLKDAERALISERRDLSIDELTMLSVIPKDLLGDLAGVAHRVRLERCGPIVEIEGIISAKTGGCPEDCHFCSQSSRHNSTVQATPFLDTDEVVRAAKATAEMGASEFCIVLAIRGPDERIMKRIETLVPIVESSSGLRVSVSAGILTEDQAERLARAGVHRYNHNIETSQSFFGHVVSSHRWEERAETCKMVLRHNMELCCGVLLGMGESPAQRVELLTQLRELSPHEIPINFLNPRPGTPLADRPIVDAWEAIRWIALFRLALPDAILRYSGGREITLGDLQAMGMTSGINALIVGNYLTTLGRSPSEDFEMIRDLNMPIGVISPAI